MEDILDVYQRPYNTKIPVVCMDEKPYQLLGEKRESLPARPGSLKKTDSEYVRNGTYSIFMFVEPRDGFRHVEVLERHTKIDFTNQVRYLLEDCYPDKETVILVMDNLNTHNISSRYKAFDAQTARSLARSLEIHYTPKNGSWLNIAETELSAMTSQCLGVRIPTINKLNRELCAWKSVRNGKGKCVNWQFTTDKAKVKLKSLYPNF